MSQSAVSRDTTCAPARALPIALFMILFACTGWAVSAAGPDIPPPAPGAGDGAVARPASPEFDEALVSDLVDGRLDAYSLQDAALIASGVDNPEDLAKYRARLDEILRRTTEKVGKGGSPERRARRLLAELHRRALHRYEPSADRFADLLDKGSYNCVSATLLYVMAARAVGLEPVAAETPMHVFVVLQTPRRRIDIEATSPDGFDVRRDMTGFRAFVLANKYVTPEELAQRGIDAIFDEFHRLTHPVSPERVISFLYHNAGIRALQAGDSRTASRQLVNAARIYPTLAYRSEDLRTTLAWAVREQYDAGSFAEALNLADAAMRFFPDRTTVKDRFVAVGARAIEEAAGRGDQAAAEALEARVLDRLVDDDSRRKLVNYAAPVLARSALVARDWAGARRHADQFVQASPDPIEAGRFARWVAERADEGEGRAGQTPPELVTELREAQAAAASAQDGEDHVAVAGAIVALASEGRFVEALAVGRVERAALTDEAGRERLDVLLKAVAARQIAFLQGARRWREATAAGGAALAQWPDDDALLTLHRRTLTAMAQDPYQLGAWPEALRSAGAPAPGVPLAGSKVE